MSDTKRSISEVRAGVTASGTSIEILEPMDALSNRQTSIETSNAWLEERGSLKAAAASLHRHPNAVAFHVNKAS